MDSSRQIDTTFDFRMDTPSGRDPDAWSPTLRRYHRLLWTKPLPSGEVFELLDTCPRPYLYHKSGLGEFWLSSDSVIPAFTRERRISHIVSQISDEDRNSFFALGYTMGGMMLFPAVRVNGRQTINGARGFHPLIKDRFDLTVECIRRHYGGETSPLTEVLARYAKFFSLFRDFGGYVEFFLLQDLVTDDCSAVKFSLPFDDFRTSPLPQSVFDYLHYRRLAMEFIEARNLRMEAAVR